MRRVRLKRKTRSTVRHRGNAFLHQPVGLIQRSQQFEIGRILRTNGVQTKLNIGRANDKYEREADSVSERVLNMSDASVGQRIATGTIQPMQIQRLCKGCEDESAQRQTNQEEETVQTKINHETLQRQQGGEKQETVQAKPSDVQAAQVNSNTESRISRLRSGGQSLDPVSRSFFEPRFGRNFSDVRVHNSAEASALAKSINARAFTLGNSIVFGSGEYQPDSSHGKSLMAHELTHVVQQSSGSDKAGQTIRRRRCTSADPPNKIIDQHNVNSSTINSPGDTAGFEVRFNCDIRSFQSDLEKDSGASLNLTAFPAQRTRYVRRWDGKRSYANVGTYMAHDGDYRHKLSRVLYAYRYNPATQTSTNLYATGPRLISPNATLATRAGAFSNYRSNHYSPANVETVARVIRSEMGVGNAAEQRAIAWAVRNQMLSLNTNSASVAQNHFHDAHNQAPTSSARLIAQQVLAVDMGQDTSSGAIKWFSPMSMPSQGGSCAGYDCSGGLIRVVDNAGVAHRKYAPSFHTHMNFAALAGVRSWFVRFYRL